MSLSSRVAWTEGLFLRPQHFQQEARYLDRALKACFNVVANGWGFSKLDLNSELLELGQFAIERASGFFPDGEIFDFPEHDISPLPIDIHEDAHGCAVYMCLQPKRFGDQETSLEGANTRRCTQTAQVTDMATEARSEAASVEIARLKPILKLEKKPGAGIEGFVSIAVARISDIGADGAVKLEKNFIPTVYDHSSAKILKSFITNTEGLLEGRSATLAARVTGASSGGAPEVSDYILLQTINRYLNIFRHFSNVKTMHPQELFLGASNLCAEFSVHTQPDRMAPAFKAYDHRNLTESFKPVIEEVRRCLSYIGDPTATNLPLSERGFGIQVAEITDKTLLKTSQIVLAVGASMPGEDIRRRFPKEAKIGNVDVIRDLVNIQIPGVRLKALPVAPRQIPYHAGKVYFELERKGDYWEGLVESSAVALHVGGDFPDLNLTLWAIRETRK